MEKQLLTQMRLATDNSTLGAQLMTEREFRFFLLKLLDEPENYSDFINTITPYFSSELSKIVPPGSPEQAFSKMLRIFTEGENPLQIKTPFTSDERKQFLLALLPENMPKTRSQIKQLKNIPVPLFESFAQTFMYFQNLEEENQELSQKIKTIIGLKRNSGANPESFLTTARTFSPSQTQKAPLQNFSATATPRPSTARTATVSSRAPSKSSTMRPQTGKASARATLAATEGSTPRNAGSATLAATNSPPTLASLRPSAITTPRDIDKSLTARTKLDFTGMVSANQTSDFRSSSQMSEQMNSSRRPKSARVTKKDFFEPSVSKILRTIDVNTARNQSIKELRQILEERKQAIADNKKESEALKKKISETKRDIIMLEEEAIFLENQARKLDEQAKEKRMAELLQDEENKALLAKRKKAANQTTQQLQEALATNRELKKKLEEFQNP